MILTRSKVMKKTKLRIATETEFYEAVRRKDIAKISDLIDEIDMFGGREEGVTFPLMYALFYANAKILGYILNVNPQWLEEKDINSRSLLMMLVDRNDYVRAEWLVKMGADVNVRDMYGRTPIISAALKGNWQMVKMLARSNADTKHKDNMGRNAEWIVRKSGVADWENMLMTKQEVETEAIFRRFLFMDTSTAEKELSFDNIYLLDKNGHSMIYYAIAQNSIELVSIVLDKGLSIDYKDADGNTPLFYAIIIGNCEMTSYLIDRGANINAVDNLGRTPIFYALTHLGEFGCKLTKTLIDAGADVNPIDKFGETPLIFSIMCGFAGNEDFGKIKLFLDKGGIFSANANSGRTILHYAVMRALQNKEYFVIDLIRMIMDNGGRADMLDNKGKTPMDYVENYYNNFDEIQILSDEKKFMKLLRRTLRKRWFLGIFR